MSADMLYIFQAIASKKKKTNSFDTRSFRQFLPVLPLGVSASRFKPVKTGGKNHLPTLLEAQQP